MQVAISYSRKQFPGGAPLGKGVAVVEVESFTDAFSRAAELFSGVGTERDRQNGIEETVAVSTVVQFKDPLLVTSR